MSRIRKILLALLLVWVFLIVFYYLAFGMSGGSGPIKHP
jgi:hypothetical protein